MVAHLQLHFIKLILETYAKIKIYSVDEFNPDLINNKNILFWIVFIWGRNHFYVSLQLLEKFCIYIWCLKIIIMMHI